MPLKTTADDVRNVVRYLKTKPTGATVSEARATVDEKVLDGRKLAAYVAWGITARDDNRLKLTDRGWAMARESIPENEVFRQVIDGVRPYRSVLEWVNHQQLETVTAVDVAVHWHEHHREAVSDANDNTLRENAICFFNLAEAAGFGTMTIGRAGKPTRFEPNLQEVRSHVESGPAAPPWEGDDADKDQPEDGSEPDVEELGLAETSGNGGAPEQAPPTLERLHVFISHGKNKGIVDQVETMLGLADIESEVAEKEETTAIPVPDKVFDAMRRCQAGIIAVTVEEGRKDENGEYVLNENVLIEIGAAFVLYERRVVLIWDKRLSVPSNLQGLYRCEVEGDELSWTEGMKLMKAIQGFKKQPSER